jgi:predicted nucleic acid-binding protein
LFRAGARAAIAAIGRIEESRRVRMAFPTAAHHRRAREWLHELANQPVTYTDAMSFAVMESLSCTDAFTFDHDFAVAGFARWSLDGRDA